MSIDNRKAQSRAIVLGNGSAEFEGGPYEVLNEVKDLISRLNDKAPTADIRVEIEFDTRKETPVKVKPNTTQVAFKGLAKDVYDVIMFFQDYYGEER